MIIITFYTHHSAQLTNKMIKNSGIISKMAPVPRKLSSSCGSCVIAECDNISMELVDEDFEAVYKAEDDSYILLCSNE